MEVSWAVGLRREEACIFGDHSFCPVTKGSQAYPLSKVEKKKKKNSNLDWMLGQKSWKTKKRQNSRGMGISLSKR